MNAIRQRATLYENLNKNIETEFLSQHSVRKLYYQAATQLAISYVKRTTNRKVFIARTNT